MSLAKHIDHTYLKQNCTSAIVQQICADAKEYGFASVCIPPSFVSEAKLALDESDVKVCTVIGFPNGYNTTAVKVSETFDAISKGAKEIDMVIAIGRLKEGDFEYVEDEIAAIYDACHTNNAVLKVIIETALLTEEEKIKACEICAKVGVDYVKTSTGFSHSGATIADVALMRKVLPEQIKIKAAGGIKTATFANELIAAGANRLGCSSSIELVNE